MYRPRASEAASSLIEYNYLNHGVPALVRCVFLRPFRVKKKCIFISAAWYLFSRFFKGPQGRLNWGVVRLVAFGLGRVLGEDVHVQVLEYAHK